MRAPSTFRGFGRAWRVWRSEWERLASVARVRLRTVVWAGSVVGLGLLVGCGSSGSAAQSAAADFYQAVEGGQSAVACGLLAPETRRELEQAENATCEAALSRMELPAAGATDRTERFGQHAVVRFARDTVFLAEYDDGWKVVAAGCTPRDGLPYDCDVEGG